jgi:hypothetical protein
VDLMMRLDELRAELAGLEFVHAEVRVLGVKS